MSDDEYISFGEVARRQCSMQAQYCSRYIDGRHTMPRLGEGLRFIGDPTDYHRVQIHRADVAEFVRRVIDYRRSTGQIA